MAITRSQTNPRLSEVFLSSCHVQAASPLFRLSAELRNMVFTFAMRAYTCRDKPRRNPPFGSGPVDEARYKTSIDTSLLLTCKRAYIDGCKLPTSLHEHTFWCWAWDPDEPRFPSSQKPYFSRMSTWQLQDVKIRIIYPSLMAPYLSGPPCNHKELVALPNLRKLTIELRVVGAWDPTTLFGRIENSKRVPDWLGLVNRLTDLEVLIIEYEASDPDESRYRHQLDDNYCQTMRNLPFKRLRYQARPVEDEHGRLTRRYLHPWNVRFQSTYIGTLKKTANSWRQLKFVRKDS